MRSLIIYCLFYASLTFGVWTALLFAYFHHNHVSIQEEKTQPPSLGLSLRVEAPGQLANTAELELHQLTRHLPVNRNRPRRRRIYVPKSSTNFNSSNLEHHNDVLKYGFNANLSRRLGIIREVPDTRDKKCFQKKYPTHLLTASVVICFHNEEFNALLRTVSSVLYLTPPYFLREIILVDDRSEYDDLQDKLEHRLKVFKRNIKIIRNKNREGLIRSRLIGADHASGDVLVFLDSHCEVNRVWLEPLMAAIAENHKVVVCPVLDVIDFLTLQYKASPIQRGAFDWNLQFKWDTVFSYEMEGPDGAIKPIRSPAMSGGIFAIYRPYFYEIGQYDKDMNLWGGENVEISLRIWMCGGQLLVIPCSRVGHINRKHKEGSFAIRKVIIQNYLRVVHVWLDEYKDNFFLQNPSLKLMNYGDISKRVELRNQLRCKSFQWYLDTLFPDLEAFMNKEREEPR
ncbi:inactive polypeptide N-acetylgalactosaminyltransferase-like protein 5 [Thomomys bottae]